MNAHSHRPMETTKTEEIVPVPRPGSKYATLDDLPYELYDYICDELVRATESPVGKSGFKVLKKYTPTVYYHHHGPQRTLATTKYLHPLLALAATSKRYDAAVESFCHRQCISGQYVTTTATLKDNKKFKNQFLYRLWTMCAFCHVRSIRKGIIAKFLNLCANCDKIHFPKITMVQAKRKYGLTEEQLKDPYNGIRKGGFMVQGAEAMNFDLGDVARYAERIHKCSNEEWLAQKKSQKTNQEEAARAKKRRIVDAIEAGLLANGLFLRITALGPTVQTISTKSPYICMPAFTSRWICQEAKQPAHFAKYEYLLQQATVRVAYDSYNRLFGILPEMLNPHNNMQQNQTIPNFSRFMTVGQEWNTPSIRRISLPNLVLFHLFTLDFGITGLTSPEEHVRAYLELMAIWEPGKDQPAGNKTPWSILYYPVFIKTPDFPPGLAAEDDAIQRHINRLYSHYPKQRKVDALKTKITAFLNSSWLPLKDKAAYENQFMMEWV